MQPGAIAQDRSAPGARRPETDLEELIAELRHGGDRERVFEELFHRCYRLVRHFFRGRGASASDAEDLVQETFLHAFRGIDSYRGDARFETWLLSIARNAHRHDARSRAAGKRAGPEVPLDEALRARWVERWTNGDSRSQPLGWLESQERLAALRRALRRMPPQMRRCATLRLLQGFSYREIADVLKLSPDSVKVQLHRARARLRDALRGHVEEVEP